MDAPSFYRVSVKGVVYDEQGRILLARESSGKWDLLGGGLDHDENPKAGLRREFLEEAGLTIISISDRPLFFLTAYNERRGTYMANVLYEITLQDLDFKPSAECQEVRFFTPPEMLSLDMHANGYEFARILSQPE